MPRRTLFVLLLLAAGGATAQAAYKWTDAKGTVHYSESAPPAGTRYSRVTLSGSVQPAQAPTPAADAAGDASAAATPAAPATMQDTPENRAKLCGSLKANLDALRSAGPVVMEQGGKPTTLDDAQRKQQLDSAQSQYSQYCGQ